MKRKSKQVGVGALLIVLGVAAGVLAWSSVRLEPGDVSLQGARTGEVSIVAQGLEPSGADHGIRHAIAVLQGSHSIIGRGVVIRADADDLVSQPDGAAGTRIACGVIGIASGD